MCRWTGALAALVVFLLLGGQPAVAAQSTSTTLSLGTGSVVYGSEQAEQFAVAVSSSGGVVSGRAAVKAGATTLCSVILSGGKGACSPSATKLKPGSYTVVAVYAGTTQFATSTSAPEALTVSKATTSSTLSLSAANVAYGSEQTETFSVAVTATGVVPAGIVTVKAASTTLCKAKLSSGKGVCSLSATELKTGSYSVVASYPGNSKLTASTSIAMGLGVVGSNVALVAGKVLLNGAPVSGATVWIGSTEAKASGSGAFSMTVVPGTYKWILSLPGGIIYGAPVAVAGDMNVNLNLIEHTVTVVAKNPSGEPVAGVKTKAEGGFNTKLAPVAATLAPGFEAEAVAWDHPQATTNAEGKLQFSIPDIEPPQSTVELIPPPESGLVNTTIDVANVTTDETREVTVPQGAHVLGTVPSMGRRFRVRRCGLDRPKPRRVAVARSR